MPTIELLFDLTKAYTSLNGLGGMLDKKLPQKAGNFEKMFGQAMGRTAAFTMVKFNLIFGAISKTVKAAANQFPEIGKTMSFAGNIISRNLLMPMRKELLPYLNRFLKWATENRKEFVRWGSVIRNVFRALIDGVKTIIKPFRDAFNQIASWFKNMLKVESLADGFNILLGKVVAIFSVMYGVIKNIFDSIMNNAIGPFFEEIKKAFPEIKILFEDNFSTVIKIFKEVFDIINKVAIETGALKLAFSLLGSVFAESIKTVLTVANTLLQTLLMLVGSVGDIVDWAKGDITISQMWDRVNERGSEGFGKIFDNWKDLIDKSSIQGNVRDILGRAEGGPVTAGQPYIVGEKRPELFIPNQNGRIEPNLNSLGGKSVSNVFNINVVSNNAETAGQQIINELRKYATIMGTPGVFA